MKVKEILSEGIKSEPLANEVSRTLPGTWVIPELGNTDTYRQYRYGLALATAAAAQDPDHNINPFAESSAFGEYLTITAYAGKEEKRVIELAAKLMGVKLKQVADEGSAEGSDISVDSPIPKR